MTPPLPARGRGPRIGSHRRLQRLFWLLPLPGLLTALTLIWTGPGTPLFKSLASLLLVGTSGLLAFLFRDRLRFALGTLTNVVAAMRDGDFSVRPRAENARDPLGVLASEINALADVLRDQRLGALEATNLLRTTIEELDAAIFTFDDRSRLRLANRAAERLLARPIEQLLGRTAADLHLAACLEGEPARVVSMSFPGAMGRFGIRRSGFRQDGRPHQLLVLADLSRALRDEERQAWQRLVRVLGHELNNSLAPIKSVATSLESLVRKESRPADWEDDLRDGLALISARAEALSRFMQAYSRLARLPVPQKTPVSIALAARRVADLETRVPVRIKESPDCLVAADPDQLDQLLINLVRNAADAVLESPALARPSDSPPPAVEISWNRLPGEIEVNIADDGTGIANPANLFVPFFTTKPRGSGIGLSLCRQIAEAHEGHVTLENRPDRRGGLARLRLPVP